MEKNLEKHCVIGIISFIWSVVANLTGMLGFMISIVSDAMNDNIYNPDALSTGVVFGLILLLLSVFSCIVPFILGLVCLLQKNSKKVFGIIGLILSTLPVLAFMFMILVGSIV